MIKSLYLSFDLERFEKLKEAYQDTDFTSWEDFVFETICGK